MYLYILNRPTFEEQIAQLECLYLTGSIPDKGYALSDVYIDSSRPAYMELCAEIYFIDESLDTLYKKIEGLNYNLDNYRVRFINTAVHIEFNARKAIEKNISNIFTGSPDLKKPVDDFIITYTGSNWLFGKFIWKTENRWLLYNKKPYTFCNSLSARMARALVNIASQGNTALKLLDPCCGMGTVLLEALDMGIDAYGCDINNTVVEDANNNLRHFGFSTEVKCQDAISLEGSFDVSIVDLPYGLLSKRGSDMYKEIIGNMRSICSRSVILSSTDISGIITDAGFEITGGCIVHKGGLDRHIAVCR